MNIVVDIDIEKPKEIVWSAITDIENWSQMISGIIKLKIVNKPEEGIVDLRWKETRRMFGKEASETMWITDAVENEYYCTRAESHGSVYTTKISLHEAENNTRLSMAFSAEAQSFLLKIVSACMGFFVKGSMTKLIRKDLEDIKTFVEQ